MSDICFERRRLCSALERNDHYRVVQKSGDVSLPRIRGTRARKTAPLLPADLRPGILQRRGAIEHQALGGRIEIDAKISEALELEAGRGGGAAHARLELRVRDDSKRFGIQIGKKIAALLRVLAAEEPVVEPHLAIDGMCCRDPVQGRLGLPSVGSVAAAGRWIVGRAKLDDIAVAILRHAAALDEVR